MDEICFQCMTQESESDYPLTMKTCLTCHNSICNYCEEKHEKQFIGHIVHLTAHVCNPERFCKEHKGEHLDSFCCSCDSMICRSCARQKHCRHSLQSISETGRSIRNELKGLKSNFKYELTAIEKDLVSGSAELSHIKTEFSMARRETEKLLEDVYTMMVDRIRNIEHIKKVPYGLHDDIDHLLEHMNSLVARRRVNTVLLSCVSSVSRPGNDYDLVFKYLRFKKEMSMIKKPIPMSSTFRHVNIQLCKPSESDVKRLIPKLEIGLKSTFPKNETINTAQKETAKLLEEREEALKQKTLMIREKEQEISIKQLKREKNADGAQQRNKKEAVKNLAQQRVGEAETKALLKLKQQQSSIEESLHAVIQENEKLIAKLEKAEQDKENFRESYDSISSQFSIIKQKLRSTETELEEVRTRLSRVAGAQLTSGNPGITDLGDIHRPTKIAEMYSSLYDTEWTEAMDELIKTKWTEQQIIKHLCLTLQVCYRACNKIAEEQLIEIYQKLDIGASKEQVSQKIVTHAAEVKQLKDVRKGLAVKMFKSIAKMILEEKRFDKEVLGHRDTDRELLDEICRTPYIERCVLVCWLMVIQDPEMYIDEDLKPGSAFNKDTYREYTQRGTKVAFSVWPALYLNKKGPLMMKGVAQPEKPDYM